MPDLLAEILVREQIIPALEVEEAVKRQVIEGGSLDTVLLEAGVISETDILRALGEAYALPTAGRADIEAVPPHIPRLFPLVFAETYHLVPFRLIGQNLGVLVNRPTDEQLFDRIRERLSLHVKPTVTTEVRLHHAMCRLYGTEVLPRYRSLLVQLDGQGVVDEINRFTDSTPHVLSWGLSTVRATPARRREDTKKGSGLLARLAAAADRDDIVDILLEVTGSTFEFVAMFVVRGDQVNGWRGINAAETSRIARLTLPVTLPSVFQTIYATNGHYLGPLPTNSINLKLVEDMGRTPPRAAFLAPILVAGKLVAIIYADNGPKPVSSKRVASLLLVTNRAGMCLETLIRRKKAATAQMIADTTGQPLSATAAQDLEAEPPPPTDVEITVLEDEEFELLPEIKEIAPSSPTPFAAPAPHAVEMAPPPPSDVPPIVETADRESWESIALGAVDTAPTIVPAADESPPAAATAEMSPPTDPAASILGAAESPPPAVTAEPFLTAEASPPEVEEDDGYVAFSDIDETPAQSVGEWEDVLVETSGLERDVDNRPHSAATGDTPAPPAVTWDHVIAEAEAAPDLLQAPAARSVEVAGTKTDERAILLDSLDAADPEVWRNAIEKLLLLGDAIDDEIQLRFPGKISFDPFAADVQLPPFSGCSGVTALIAARSTSAAQLVLPFLESDKSVQRFFAVYYLYAVSYTPAVELLARRLYDAEPRNRFLAADALRRYHTEPAYRRIVQGLRDHLKVPVFEAQVATVQVLGQLREPSAVPSLIPLVVSPRQALARAASSALTVICGQSFGTDVSRWAEWWQSHFNKPRETWLTDGTRHADPNVRKIATRELQLLTGRGVTSDSGATPEPHPENS